MTHEDAWHKGTNIQTALRFSPEETRAECVKMVKGVVDFCEMKKTLQNVEQILFATETLIEEFPAMKLEEWRLACDGMKQGKFGKYFERMKVEEFRAAFQAIEERRAEIIERSHERSKNDNSHRTFDPSNITFQPQSMSDLRRKRAAAIFDTANAIIEAKKERENGDTSDNSKT